MPSIRLQTRGHGIGGLTLALSSRCSVASNAGISHRSACATGGPSECAGERKRRCVFPIKGCLAWVESFFQAANDRALAHNRLYNETMLTDAPPRNRKSRKFFLDSDRLASLPLPPDEKLSRIAAGIETALKTGATAHIHTACDEFLRTAAEFYGVPRCAVRVLLARPLRVREQSKTELFGDYHPDTRAIRVWTKTAVRKEPTSFGTFLSTLCHEFCHHLDFHHFAFENSWHTRGFYQRTAALYHHAKGTPKKELIWIPVARERWRIDWQRTNRTRTG